MVIYLSNFMVESKINELNEFYSNDSGGDGDGDKVAVIVLSLIFVIGVCCCCLICFCLFCRDKHNVVVGQQLLPSLAIVRQQAYQQPVYQQPGYQMYR